MATTTINFIRNDDFYNEEKPYLLTYEPPGDFPKTNVKLDNRHMKLEDIRGRENEFNVEDNGFAIMKIQTKLSYEDFDNEDLVKRVYLKEVAETLKTFLGASRIQIFEHIVRKRDPIYPISTGEPYIYNQPTSIAHIDTTPEWSTVMAERLNPTRGPDLLKSRYQCVNIWRPLKGPLRDWPLALCDISTVDLDDIHPGDLVHPNFVIENCQVNYNPKQKWHYISGQLPSEAWVFLQSDSKDAWIKSGVPHSAFPHPDSQPDDPPRESIEVRAFAWYE